ncbi:DUF1824 family protein [Leptolyngbya sp. BL0902]|uniref:DUF1824 family protein n=1 Tax=Leptolyngbya sp. BL0902 TaxID=1115757 RepID=UPI001CECCC06|nr:DUF1824 family protein [Leptolyngbya sp. BL0902]
MAKLSWGGFDLDARWDLWFLGPTASSTRRRQPSTPIACLSSLSSSLAEDTMVSTHPTADLAAIRKRLNVLSCLKTPPALSAADLDQMRQDLATFNDLSDYQTLGICADTLSEAKEAMESFLAALGVTVTLDLPTREGAVYLKFNTLKGAWYLDDYSGPSRGVLITFHSSEPEYAELVGTYGPFPFTLFRP